MRFQFSSSDGTGRRHAPRRKGWRAGWTAAEILIATSIFGFLATGGLSLFLGAAKGWDGGSGKSESDTNASLALQLVAREVQDAKSATVSSDGNALTLQMPLVNDQGCYDRAFDGDQLQYYISNNTLYQRANGGTPRLLAREISDVTFSQSGGIVNLLVHARVRTGQKWMETEFKQAVALRNREMD
jgi:hypothetical protein